MEEKFLNIEHLKYVLKKGFWIIVLIIFISTSIGAYATYSKNSNLKLSYVTKTEIFIGNTPDMETMHTKEQLDSYNSIINYCIELAYMNNFSHQLVEKYNIQADAEIIQSGLSIIKNEKLPIVEISYTNSNTNEMIEILNAASKEFKESIKKIIERVHIKTLEEPIINTIYPTKKNFILPSFVVGLLLSLVLVFLLDYFDNRIKNKEEVENLINVVVIGEILEEDKKIIKGENNVHS
ncbi:hypothetical protein [Clostridium tarantellae]|uniref:Polysaccharide chain length determinant N-terminal domain-containing protein n=1 Tax=Clostridium tarantellae TaxID=39493 RepID=A0A6I1MJE9_9CLOT|nr:hypothetical protein [Clostridium tarantellae]MPQ43064.1 hypothetical protein [Clostridium tarantellae]